MSSADDSSSVLGVDSAVVHARVASGLFGKIEEVRIGRYPILRKLGEGGMGSVYAAYDESLDRRIAIKLVLPILGEDDDAKLRLRREAQALAQVAHANVVGVHEVGEHEGRVYVAMEFVKGATLRAWLEEERSVDKVVDVLVQVGRGLAAVHAAGIVHRDVKPENVMVEEGGRARVMDFGLARIGTREAVGMLSTLEQSGRSPEDPIVTREGVLVGTPAYMAPEQFRGDEVDARTDQFAYCVMFWEALYGARPFAGRTLTELGERVTSGQRESVTARRGVRVQLRRALERGLAVDPADRHASMEALLSVIASSGRGGAARVAVFGGAAVVVAGAVALSRGDDAPCTGADAIIGAAWNADTRADVEAAFAAADATYADASLAYVVQALDGYANAWVEQWRDACEATSVRGEQSTDLLDRRMACLDRARFGLAATVDILGAADRDVVGRADSLIEGLPWLPDCSDRERLLAEVAPPDDPDLVSHVADARERLASARASRAAGRNADARAILEALIADPQTLAYAPLHAEAAAQLAHVDDLDGAYASAETGLRAALSTALTTRSWTLSADIAARLAFVVGYHLSRHDEGLALAQLSLDLARAVGAGGRAEAEALHMLGAIADAAGKDAEAEQTLRRAVALRETLQGDASLDAAATHTSLGIALADLGRDADAEVEYRRAIEIIEANFGPEHPLVLKPLNNLLVPLARQGRKEERDAVLQRLITLAESVHGPNHPEAAIYRINRATSMADPVAAEAEFRTALARLDAGTGGKHPAAGQARAALSIALRQQRRFEEAEVEARKGLQIALEVTPDDARTIASLRDNLASCLVGLGRHADGEAEYAHALADRERALPADHHDVAMARLNYGLALRRRQDFVGAEPLFRRGLEDSAKTLTGDHPLRRELVVKLGETLVDLDRHAEAADVLAPQWEREDVAKPITSPRQRAFLAWALARSRHGTGDDTAAVELARRAQALLQEQPTPDDEATRSRVAEALESWTR